MTLKDNDIIELANELNIKISCIDKININDINESYDIILSDLIDIELNKLIKITKKYLILLNTQNDNTIKLFMEKNDDWIYANNDWTWENKITIIKKKEEHENNIICYNFWGIYNQAIIKFNVEPIKKILISGNNILKRYPERYYLSCLKNNNNNINVYKYNTNNIVNDNNNFNFVLNKYLCCFVSSVYVRNKKYKKSLNTHTILLKNYEVLASGSLLLVPDYEELYLKKIGLVKSEHYLTLNFNYNNDDMNKQINNLLKEDNISNINKIRYNGYIYAINNLTNKQRFEELNEIFMKS